LLVYFCVLGKGKQGAVLTYLTPWAWAASNDIRLHDVVIVVSEMIHVSEDFSVDGNPAISG